MIAAWMLYATVVGAALGLAAALAERALRPLERPVRGLWGAALAGTALVPAWALLAPLARRNGRGTDGGFAVEIGPLAVGGPEAGAIPPPAWEEAVGAMAAGLAPLDWPLLGAWGLATAVLGIFLLASFLRLRRERRGWRRAAVDGHTVHVSAAYGPAVFGFFRTGVVVPRWFLDLEPEARRLALLHEREHARAGDSRLTLSSLLLATALPWNPALWWQLRRLRLAVEVDCDRRVLARGIRRLAYGRLLLAGAGGGRRNPLVTPALVEDAGDLERRIEMLSERRPRRPVLHAGLALAAAAALVAMACEAPVPPEPSGGEPAAEAGEQAAEQPSLPAGARASERPEFIPYDTPPRLQNVSEVQFALHEEYPADLRGAGVAGRVELWLLIDASGRVARVEVKTSSQVEALDRAALAVARIMAFEPAEHEGVPTKVWVTQWLSFELEQEVAAAPAS